MSKQKILIVFTVLVDVIGLGIVIPVLPFYVESFGATPFMVTVLLAVFSLFSFFSAPLLGSLSDRFGRRPILVISILSTAIGWIIFASAKSLMILFLGRIIDGLAAGNFSTAQSYLVDISKDDKERTANLGLVGAIFGVGLILGPFLGGILGGISHSFPFWFVGCLALVNAFLAWRFLPESHHHLDKDKKLQLNPLLPLKRAWNNKKLLPAFWAWFLFGLAAVSMHSVFALYMKSAFGYGHFAAGMAFTGVGIIIAINQGVVLKHFWLKNFSEPNLEYWLLLFFAVGFLLMGFHNLWQFLFGLILVTFGQSVLRVVMTSQIVGTSTTSRGELLGVLTSIASLGMIISPIVAGFIFEINISWPFWLAAIYAFIAFVLVAINRRRMSNKDLPEDVTINTPI